MDTFARRRAAFDVKKVFNINNLEQILFFPQAPEHLFGYQAGLTNIYGATQESEQISFIGLNGCKKGQQGHASCTANDGSADYGGSGRDCAPEMVSVGVIRADTARNVKVLCDGGCFGIKDHKTIWKE